MAQLSLQVPTRILLGNKFLPSLSQAQTPPALHPPISRLSRQHFICPHKSHVSESKPQPEPKKLLQSERKTLLHVPDAASATSPWLGIFWRGQSCTAPLTAGLLLFCCNNLFFPYFYTVSLTLGHWGDDPAEDFPRCCTLMESKGFVSPH